MRQQIFGLKINLSPHLTLLERLGIIEHAQERRIDPDTFLEEQVSPHLEEADLILLLFSPDLLSTKYFHSKESRLALTRHQLKMAQLIPIYFREIDWDIAPLQKIKGLPSNKQAIRSKHWANEDEGLQQTVEELKEIIKTIQEKKAEHLAEWETTKEEHTVEAYRDFLKKNKHSIYSQEAQKRQDTLYEKELWETATEDDEMISYLEYLKKAPLMEHEEEAYEKIKTIEGDEEITWQDAQNNEHIFLYIEYRRRFPKGKYLKEAEEQIKYLLDQELGEEKQDSELNINRAQLDFEANANLKEEERLAYDYFWDYAMDLTKRIEKFINILEGRQFYIITQVLIIISFEVLFLAPQWPFFYENEYTRYGYQPEWSWSIGDILNYFVVGFFVIVFHGLLIFWYLGYASHIKFCKDEKEKIWNKGIAMKAALVSGNRDKVRSLIKEYRKIEHQTLEEAPQRWFYNFLVALFILEDK